MDTKLTPFASPFVWGSSDCCLSVADCLVGMGLPDPMAIYRGRYDSERGAYRMFRPDGGLEGAMAARMAENGYVADAPDSFVGLVETDLGPTVCLRESAWWWAKSLDGAQAYDDRHAYRRWGHPCHKPSR